MHQFQQYVNAIDTVKTRNSRTFQILTFSQLGAKKMKIFIKTVAGREAAYDAVQR